MRLPETIQICRRKILFLVIAEALPAKMNAFSFLADCKAVSFNKCITPRIIFFLFLSLYA